MPRFQSFSQTLITRSSETVTDRDLKFGILPCQTSFLFEYRNPQVDISFLLGDTVIFSELSNLQDGKEYTGSSTSCHFSHQR